MCAQQMFTSLEPIEYQRPQNVQRNNYAKTCPEAHHTHFIFQDIDKFRLQCETNYFWLYPEMISFNES